MTDTEDINHTFVWHKYTSIEWESKLPGIPLLDLWYKKHIWNWYQKGYRWKKYIWFCAKESQAPHTMRKVASLPSNPKLFLILFGITTSKYI